MVENTGKYIQVLGYRPFTNDEGKEVMEQRIFAEARSVVSLFENLEKVLSRIPEAERWNVHWTNANCHKPDKAAGIKKRSFAYQECIIFDLDDIDLNHVEEYISIVIKVLRLDKYRTGIFNSGHGLHFVIALPEASRIKSADALAELKPYYSAVCGLLNQEFFMNGLSGKADPIRLATKATLRLPNTINRKEGLPDCMATVIQGRVAEQDFKLQDISGELNLTEEANENVHVEVDTSAVLSGCKFLQYSLANQPTLTEPEWYATIGVLAFIPDVGKELCHTYSKGHEGYEFEKTEAKIDQALGLGKPRVCSSIELVYPGCKSCEHYKKCKTPLSIKSESFVATKNTGFHTIHLDQFGNPKKFVPNYEDLVKFYKSKNQFIVSRESGIMYRYTGTHWESVEKTEVKYFATTHFKPIASNKMREEFVGLLYSTNVQSEKFFDQTIQGFVNFKNGVLRLDGRILLPHSPDYGFQYCLPYNYEPNAEAPAFKEMLASVTLDDEGLQNILLEFMAYAISNIPPEWGEKALILDGNGSNGKSTFLDVIRNLVGENCYSSVPLADLNDAVGRQVTLGKLFNLCEETEYDALKKAAMFKALVTGGTTTFKKLFHQPVTMKFKAKLILACNSIPSTNDDSDGVFRRLLIVPFRNKYSAEKGNLDKSIRARVNEEMSGVYNLVLDAYDRLMKQGGFSSSEASDAALKIYRKEADFMSQFIDDCLVQGDPDVFFLTNDHLTEQFLAWAERNNVMRAKNLSTQILLKKFRNATGEETSFKRVNNKTFRGFRGFDINESGEVYA